MVKVLLVLAGLIAAAGGALVWRADLDPLAATYLPAPVTATVGHLRQALGIGASDPVHAAPARASASPAVGPAGGKQADSAAPAKKGAGAAPVTIAAARLSDMPIVLSAPGTVEALATVAIKPRVDGQVVEVGFKEGDMVTAGSILYKLDDRLVRAQIRQAEATLARDQASLKDAMAILQRKETLLVKKYATEATTDTARQQVEVLRANIDAAKAQIEMQKTQLDYLTIRAPITGRTGSVTARLGAFVRSADPNALVTINQTKPIAVAFALPQVNLEALKSALATGSQAEIIVPGTRPARVRGTLIFVDNQVDKTTGTVTAKVSADNNDELLWPGQAVTVDLTVEVRKDIVSVPASAVLPAQQGMITWVVGADNRVSVRVVKQDRVIGQTSFLVDGLKPGERVVTDGQLRLSQGASVSIRDPSRGGPDGGAGKAGGTKGRQPDGDASKPKQGPEGTGAVKGEQPSNDRS